ncbi:hypothetical protein AVEN_17875-1 [Araneus ventricosus]|uniref:Uncharacterized protein n=1 Tax=Araneus ventricosus TaxID=182803 RepID=A0A4Y2JAG3_ARAVE|nr:hypothetical protein AVEN_17875-1 [Araneus ventricosus]
MNAPLYIDERFSLPVFQKREWNKMNASALQWRNVCPCSKIVEWNKMNASSLQWRNAFPARVPKIVEWNKENAPFTMVKCFPFRVPKNRGMEQKMNASLYSEKCFPFRVPKSWNGTR